jgi:hypothetical protein
VNEPFAHGFTLREDGQVELWVGRLTDLARVQVCQPPANNVKAIFRRFHSHRVARSVTRQIFHHRTQLEILPMNLRFACPSCGQHVSATRAQIGVTAPCPNCNAAVTVPKTSTLPHPPPAPRQTKFPEKKRYETTVILINHRAPVPAKPKKLKKWTNDFTDARNWLIRQLGAFRGDQYFAAIFDHKEKRSVFKEKGG